MYRGSVEYRRDVPGADRSVCCSRSRCCSNGSCPSSQNFWNSDSVTRVPVLDVAFSVVTVGGSISHCLTQRGRAFSVRCDQHARRTGAKVVSTQRVYGSIRTPRGAMAGKETDTEVKEHIKRLEAEFQYGCYVSKTPKGWCCVFGGNRQHSYVRLVSGSQILAREPGYARLF